MDTWQDKERFDRHLREREGQRYRSTRLWNPRPNEVGMLAEREFCRWAGIEMDLRNMPGGDHKIDYMVKLQLKNGKQAEFELDVKGTPTGKYAQGPVGEIFNGTVYVLCRSDTEFTKRAYIRRWEWGYRIKQQTPHDWYGNGPCHRLAVELMQPMEELRKILLAIRHKQESDNWWKGQLRRQ